jgi:hypothetical protein
MKRRDFIRGVAAFATLCTAASAAVITVPEETKVLEFEDMTREESAEALRAFVQALDHAVLGIKSGPVSRHFSLLDNPQSAPPMYRKDWWDGESDVMLTIVLEEATSDLLSSIRIQARPMEHHKNAAAPEFNIIILGANIEALKDTVVYKSLVKAVYESEKNPNTRPLAYSFRPAYYFGKNSYTGSNCGLVSSMGSIDPDKIHYAAQQFYGYKLWPHLMA